MAILTDEQKAFIVKELACFREPSEISVSVVTEWPELEGQVSRQQVHEYHPDRKGKNLAEKWQALFDATRKAFLEGASQVAISHASFRLQELLDLYRQAKKRGNAPLAASLLEQAAKETGGAYTNHRVMRGSVGHYDLGSASDEQLDRIIAGEAPEVVLGGAGES